MRGIPVLLLLLWITASAPASGREATDLAVRILESRHPVHLRVVAEASGTFRIDAAPRVSWHSGCGLSLEGTRQGLLVRGGGVAPRVVTALTVASPAFRVEGAAIRPRRYRGCLTLRCAAGSRGEIQAVLGTDLEGYVAAVVAAEMPSSSPRPALEAQAVAARSFAAALARLEAPGPGEGRRRPRGPHAAEGWDFCDLTHCQAFAGLPASDSPAWEAARATRGRVLVKGGRVLVACYHSTCGGRTADAFEVLPGLPLRGVADGPASRPWCSRSPHARWRVTVPVAELRVALGTEGTTCPGATLDDLRVVERGPDGRATRIEIRGQYTRMLGGCDFWLLLGRTLGWGRVESTWFTVRREASAFVFEGRGLGHGLGLCQHGSMEMARQGRSMARILRHYYPGSRLVDLGGRS